ncbi:alpha/beta hydrolase [Staphylococcus edaphicus]|uniref:Alpha/beta hydrolase n=1 Tax=Staphylococcus edaphicus TaxID=1955013 RepID=A0A2C6WKE8_9STAP|nr:alpha/beta hydrolase [Staphylococcus edaphicus]PHK48633.1 lysophospholipase [Staphylococcus edaphicus]UQW80925.1 alpha/beta hydrolase [Staphylococcus edaphicus]
MHYIKYVESKDHTKLYMKVNDVQEAKANVIIVHGLAEHLDRYDALTEYLNTSGFNIMRYDQRGHGRSEGQQTFYNNHNEIVEDLEAIVNDVKGHFEGKVYLIGHSMGGYTIALYGTQYPNTVDGMITSGALTRYNHALFGNPDRNIAADTYIENSLGAGVCSDKEVMEKYELDDLNAKQISMGLIFTIMDGISYLKTHAQTFTDHVLILHGKEDGLVSYLDSLQFYQEIGSEHKSLHIYDRLQHEIFNESAYNKHIFHEIVAWLELELTTH